MADFPPQLPHGKLEQIFPDVFMVSGQVRPDFNGTTWQFSRNMVVVRDGGGLTLINTLRLDPAGLTALEGLGKVEHVVRLGAFHGRDDAFYLERYGARMWAARGMPHERGVETSDELMQGAPGPVNGSTVFIYESSKTPEAMLLLEREGGVVISCDSLQNWSGPDAYFDEGSAKMMAQAGFFKPANVGPGWLRSAEPKPEDFRKVLELKFAHLLSAHGAPLLNDAKARLATTFKELFAI